MKDFTYGVGNREATVSGGTALGYDHKGSVTSRVPLVGGNAWNQTWDEYDRLIKATRTGMDDIHFTYDVLGRMIRRETKTAGTSTKMGRSGGI